VAKPYVMRRALPGDLPIVMGIVNERASWLYLRGSDQWNQGLAYDAKLARRVERGLTWLLEDDGTPIATVTVLRRSRSVLWTPEEVAEPAIYGWKLATAVERAGEGLTGLLFQWGQDWAAHLGVRCIRWSVWGASQGLHAHYQRTGAGLVRTVEVPTGEAAALFQLPARPVPGLSARMVTAAGEDRDAVCLHPAPTAA
jgi:hypothetical protein